MGPNHYGEQRRESLDEKAEGSIAAELERGQWRGKGLDQEATSEPRKVALALRLLAEATFERGVDRETSGPGHTAVRDEAALLCPAHGEQRKEVTRSEADPFAMLGDISAPSQSVAPPLNFARD